MASFLRIYDLKESKQCSYIILVQLSRLIIQLAVYKDKQYFHNKLRIHVIVLKHETLKQCFIIVKVSWLNTRLGHWPLVKVILVRLYLQKKLKNFSVPGRSWTVPGRSQAFPDAFQQDRIEGILGLIKCNNHIAICLLKEKC